MKKPYEDYEAGLQKSLGNEEEAAAYLNAALEDGSQDVFLMALRDVANARGFSQLAHNADLNRENLYRILSATGNPQLASLNTLLDALGLKLAIETKKSRSFVVAEENETYTKS
ncbi:MAG: putative addiction module antidote protein [Bacteroidales bacterium]|jgi:probable addiction module antidote protein|nr:putative addiction module antidote protein [Bacteroidales bacterium]